MKKEKIIVWISTILGLLIAFFFFLRWTPERFFKHQGPPITMREIEADLARDFSGETAGYDIFRLSGAADFEDTWIYYNYVTAEPVGIISTGVYSLKEWVSPYSRRVHRGRTYGKTKKPEVIESALDIWEDYNQYYLLELPDHSYILAQISPKQADLIARGQKVTLPIGRKAGLPSTAKSYLSQICEDYHVDTSGVLYTFNDEWQKKHYFLSFIIRFLVATVLFFTVAVGLMTIGNKIFHIEDLKQ